MAYRRNYRKKPYRKRTYRKKKSLARMVKNIISKNAETKSYDISVSSSGGQTVARTITNNIAQGDTAVDRDGNSINLKYCMMRNTFQNDTAVNMTVRQLVVWFPTGTNVDGIDQTTNFQLQIHDFLPRDLPIRYKILSDKVFYLPVDSGFKMIKTFIPLKGKRIVYDGAAASDYIRGRLWCYLYAQPEDNTATYPSDMSINARLAWTDE